MLVYFVEDDNSISYIIDKTLEKMDLNKKGFETGNSFLNFYFENKPDLVILDIMLPDISGIELLKEIRKNDSEIPIIILSALYSENDKVTALDLGADDYITKPFSILELQSRINSKLRKVSNNQVLIFKDLVVDLKKYLVTINSKEIILTKKEYEILIYLLKRPDEVLPKQDIFFDVWETNFMGETRALDMHIKSIRKKLSNAKSSVNIETSYGVGFIVGSE